MREVVVHGENGTYVFTVSVPVTEKQAWIMREATKQVDDIIKELRNEC